MIIAKVEDSCVVYLPLMGVDNSSAILTAQGPPEHLDEPQSTVLLYSVTFIAALGTAPNSETALFNREFPAASHV
ncbi:hypothetical protein BaRGS_00016984 [Batillaria attramentaria]|uniref:Uncharacterized protein n=1 Tax=Batillaria attramentaria TaxID=370345 RepID=A0ABD0KX34_9CAEN